MSSAILPIASLVLAGGMMQDGLPGGGQLYELTLMNDWYLGWAGGNIITGITHDEECDELWFVSSTTNAMYRVSLSDPTELLEILGVPGEWASGIAARGSGTDKYIYVVDANYPGEYWAYHNGSWISYSGNPATEYGTALDADEDGMLWETVHYYNIIRFYPGSSAFQAFDYNTPGESGQGITLFPFEGETGVAVAYSTYDRLEFYVFMPSDSLTFIGDAVIPVSMDYCTGLEYVAARGTFYMTSRISGLMHLLEFRCEALDLRLNTWGGLKTLF